MAPAQSSPETIQWPQICSSTQIRRSRIALFTLLFFFFQPSSQLRSTHPAHGLAEKVNESGPFVALIMAYPAEVNALEATGVFTPRNDHPWLDLSGRRFHIGTIFGVDVVSVMSGQRRLNAGVTVQILVDVFEIRGIVHFGIAGSANDSLSFGDVTVPKYVAYTGAWKWTKFTDGVGLLPDLLFGTYNLPKKGKNSLAGLVFKSEEFYSENRPMEEIFWLEISSAWFAIADKLKDMELQRCVNETFCLLENPKVVIGLRGSTADIFVDNAAYREFLFERFEISTVDEESAAIVMVAQSNNVPVIVFRGVSDLAGGTNWSSTSLNSLAATNAAKVAVQFIKTIGEAKLASFN